MSIVYYKKKRYNVEVGTLNTTIFNSYKITSYKDMKGFLVHLRARFPYGSINRRTIKSLIREWRVHNLLYSLHIKRPRTEDVDLEVKQPWYIKIAYSIFSPFYFHFR